MSKVAGFSVLCPACGMPVDLPSPSQAGARTDAGHDTVNQPLGDDEGYESLLGPAQEPDELGRLGDYRILELLGQGGMGFVFRAEDPKLHRILAVKLMRPENARNSAARQRFMREARAAAIINNDHVLSLYEVDEHRGVPFLVMPLLVGETLHQRLERDGTLPVSEVVRIGRESADGLAAAHEHGLIHRDIKPANIWLEEPRGRVKILDFGLARTREHSDLVTSTGTILGSPAYMAPEQASAGETVDCRADLFSLGCVLFQAATGRKAFPGTEVMAILSALATKVPPPANSINPTIPAPLSQLIGRLLEKKPIRRPASALEVAEALAALETDADDTRVEGRTGSIRDDSATLITRSTDQLERRRRRRLETIAVIALAVVILAIIVLVAVRPAI
jgi:serine/threonine protein kinase